MWYDEILREQGFQREELLEQYEILDEIDTGANGQVTLAVHLRSQIRYAIKCVSKQDMKSMFRGSGESCAEVQILWQCLETKSPHILPIIETYSEGDRCLIVTKLY